MYKKIYDDLLEAIEKGIYPPGSKLPSEKELMEQYNVSRITSKKALEMLVIDSRPLCEILKKSFTSYQEEADAADGTVDSKEELFDDTTGVLKKVSNYVISKLNPYLRYLF